MNRRAMLKTTGTLIAGAALAGRRTVEAEQTEGTSPFFPGFRTFKVQTSGATINCVIGGQGPVGEWIGGRETVLSPKLGARLALSDRWSVAASSSRGFRSAPGVLGDPDRPPLRRRRT